MKPFNLEKALQGAKLVTRDGREVTNFRKMDKSQGKWEYIATVEDEESEVKYTAKGNYFNCSEDKYRTDVLLADEEQADVTKLPFNNILTEANDLIYGERAAAYGSVTENFGRIAVRWSQIFGITVTPEQVGLAMIDLKISRQLNSPKRDNLVDIAGCIGCLDKLSKGE